MVRAEKNRAARLAVREVTGTALQPTTARGRRTREQLIKAAREVFEESGYIEARITDMSERAGVAHGSFYTYFRSKEEVFLAIMETLPVTLHMAPASQNDIDSDPFAVVQRTVKAFVENYKANRRISGIVEQAATINQDVQRLRRQIRFDYQQITEAEIIRMQAAGVADPDLSARCASEALAAMISNFCYTWLVLDVAFEDDEAVDTLARLWARGIGLAVP